MCGSLAIGSHHALGIIGLLWSIFRTCSKALGDTIEEEELQGGEDSRGKLYSGCTVAVALMQTVVTCTKPV